MGQLVENIDYYFNKEGYMVLTSAYLLKSGFCCGNGCFHCPYDYINVSASHRNLLIKQRDQRNEKG